MAPENVWCRIVVVDSTGAVVKTGVLGGPGRPDVGAVDVVARWALRARRSRARIELRDVCPELRDLIELAGLTVEVQR